MEFIVPSEVTDIEKAQEYIAEFQQRIYDLENLVDDLARSVEIAQFTKQYNVTQVFVEQAIEKLQDRIVLPEIKAPELKLSVIEGEADKELIKQIGDKVIAERKRKADLKVVSNNA
jgi:uncharacterized protein YjgD (DUF1641 family)